MAPQTKQAEKVRPNQKKLDAVSYVETSLYTRAAVSKKVPAMKASIRTTLANKTPAKKVFIVQWRWQVGGWWDARSSAKKAPNKKVPVRKTPAKKVPAKESPQKTVNKELLWSEDELFDDEDEDYSTPVRNALAKKHPAKNVEFEEFE